MKIKLRKSVEIGEYVEGNKRICVKSAGVCNPDQSGEREEMHPLKKWGLDSAHELLSPYQLLYQIETISSTLFTDQGRLSSGMDAGPFRVIKQTPLPLSEPVKPQPASQPWLGWGLWREYQPHRRGLGCQCQLCSDISGLPPSAARPLWRGR